MGKSCQTNSNPCNRWNPCLNNATSSNLNTTLLECKSPSNGLYCSEYCENRINSCENVTCSSNGYCYLTPLVVVIVIALYRLHFLRSRNDCIFSLYIQLLSPHLLLPNIAQSHLILHH